MRSAAFQRPQEVVEAREAPAQNLPRVVAQGLGDELAVLVEIFDPLGDNGRGDAVHIDLLLRTRNGRRQAGLIDDRLALAWFVGCRIVAVTRRRRLGRIHGIAFLGLVDLHRLAVECRVREMPRRRPGSPSA